MAYIEKGIYPSALRVGLVYIDDDDNDNTVFNELPTTTSLYLPCISLIICLSASLWPTQFEPFLQIVTAVRQAPVVSGFPRLWNRHSK